MRSDAMEYITLGLQSTFFLREMNLVPAESTSIIVRFSYHSMSVHSVSQHNKALSSATFHYCKSKDTQLPLYTPRSHRGPGEVYCILQTKVT